MSNKKDIKICPICNGKRVILVPSDDGSFMEFADCSCVLIDSMNLKLDRANIPEKYREFSLDMLSNSFMKENSQDLKIVQEYIEHIETAIKKGRGLFFQSDPGLAKTSIAVLIAREGIKLGFQCYMNRMSKFISLKFEALRSAEARNFIEWLTHCDLIVVDEIEKVYMTGDSDAMTEILVSEFFGELYDNKCSLIITSNLPRADLDKLPLHILDRFDEVITDIIFTGKSYRDK